MTQKEKIKTLQRALNRAGADLKVDGAWGPLSQAAFDSIVHGKEREGTVLASSFADPADIAAFKKCKREGHTDSYCFKYGDNGIGYWGDETSEGSGASV